MNLFAYWSKLTFALTLMIGTVFLEPVIAQDNRFLVTKDFSATYTANRAGGYLRDHGIVAISFYMKNVSDGGISVVLTQRQGDNFQVNHVTTGHCSGSYFGGLPQLPSYSFREDEARRIAVYIPHKGGLYVTVKKSGCETDYLESAKITGGIVSGNVTVIKGKRILTRPISGKF